MSNNVNNVKKAQYVQYLNDLGIRYGFKADYNIDTGGMRLARLYKHKFINIFTPFGSIDDLVHLNSDTNHMKSQLQELNKEAALVGKQFDLSVTSIEKINTAYIELLDNNGFRNSDYLHIMVVTLLDLAVIGTVDHFFQISKKIKRKLSSYERGNFLRRYRRLQQTDDSIEEITYLSREELQAKRQSERAYQAELRTRKKDLTDLLYTEGEIPQGGGAAANPIKPRPSHSKQSRLNDLTGGGSIELSKTANDDLSKKIVWRRDKTCKLYSTPTTLAEKVKARFSRSSAAVKYRDCVVFLEEEGWYFVEQGKHPKLAHVDFPEILDKTNEKQYYAQFYNYHPGSDDRYDLLRWAVYNGKRYGPSL